MTPQPSLSAGLSGTPELRAARTVVSRLVSMVVLIGVMVVLARGSMAAWYASTDAFVAPIILSPSNDSVIQSKLTLSRVLADREALEARIEQGRLAIKADNKALQMIKERLTTPVAETAAPIAVEVKGERAHHRRASLAVLTEQRAQLTEALSLQERVVKDLERDLATGLIHKADLDRELSKLGQVRLALLENRREALLGREQLASIAHDTSSEQTRASYDDLRANLEIVRLEGERDGRQAQLAADAEALAKLDSLIDQMRGRPVYRATETNQNVAFVPYTQLDGVKVDAQVLQCRLWGVLGCTPVGRISEVLVGEVVSPEPWGGESRGQYALLELTDSSAARSRSLRVRRRPVATSLTEVAEPVPPPAQASR